MNSSNVDIKASMLYSPPTDVVGAPPQLSCHPRCQQTKAYNFHPTERTQRKNRHRFYPCVLIGRCVACVSCIRCVKIVRKGCLRRVGWRLSLILNRHKFV